MARLSRNNWVVLAAAAVGAAATLAGAWLANHPAAVPDPVRPDVLPRAPLGILPPPDPDAVDEILHLNGWSFLPGHHYLAVRTPQGDLWLQEGEVRVGPRGTWSGSVRLGQIGLGHGKAYTVFLAASPHELQAHEIEDRLPDHVVVSKPVTVVRRLDPDS